MGGDVQGPDQRVGPGAERGRVTHPEIRIGDPSLTWLPYPYLSHYVRVRNTPGDLSPEKIRELDQLLQRGDHLNILKTRACYTLKYLDS